MTGFLIGFPDIPFEAASITSNLTASIGYEAHNTITGGRGDSFRLAASTVSDLALTYSLSADAQAEFAWIGRASMLKGSNVQSITLNAGSTIYQNTDFQNATLVGRKLDDFIATFARCAPAKPFVLTLSASPGSYYPMSKVYMGLFFDFGRDPIKKISFTQASDSELSRSNALSFSLTWEGIGADKMTELSDSLLAYADINPVILYDSSAKVLPGCVAMHAKISGHTIEPDSVPGQYRITLSFEELI